MKLHLGAGYKRFDGFLNVDFDAECNPDFVVDLEKDRWPFDDNTVSEVKAHHLFEHLGDPGFFHFLKELYRVCEPNAVIEVVVPHHRHDCFINDPTHRRPITIEGMRLFSKAHNKYCIEIEDGSSRLGMYYDIDFEIVEFHYGIDPLYQPMVHSIQPGSDAEKEFGLIIRERNNVIVETWMTLVVIK